MGFRSAVLALTAGVLAVCSQALADGTSTDQYFIAFRAATNDPAPHYVTALTSASGDQTTPFQACDGTTYYLSQADSASVAAAMTNQDTVQLQTAPQGTAPQDSTVLCLVQASP